MVEGVYEAKNKGDSCNTLNNKDKLKKVKLILKPYRGAGRS